MPEWLSARELRNSPSAEPPPHVVILGAGASRAAFPHGDAQSTFVPLMSELDRVAGNGWRSLIEEAQPLGDNFEERFAYLKESGRYTDRVAEVEADLASYFGAMTLPDEPTLYDHMVLGLRGQDTIATFNWDPFLLLAYKRHVSRFSTGRLPDLRFLHGCVVYASCEEHDVLGYVGGQCPDCGKALRSGKPVYPDKQKDYVSDPLLRREWDTVLHKVERAFHLTIFGYSGPVTDGKARLLLERAWQPADRKIDHLEVIDLESTDVLYDRWRKLIPFSHLLAHRHWHDSSIAKWPRRTNEWKGAASRCGVPAEAIGPCQAVSLEALDDWYAEIAATEKPSASTFRSGVQLGT